MTAARTLFDMTPETPSALKPWQGGEAEKKTAKQKRNAVLEGTRERSGDFVQDVLAAIRGLPADEYTGEGIRVLLTAQGHTAPHANAWGSAIALAVKQGLLIGTGEYRNMTSERSNARKTQVYRKGAAK